MSSCWCDYEYYYTVYIPRTSTAKKSHRCSECGNDISAGERYERVFAAGSEGVDYPKTCCRCLDLREYVKAHIPCFCWAHYNMIEMAMEAAQEYAHEAPGLLFGAYRREIAIQRYRNRNRQQRHAACAGI